MYSFDSFIPLSEIPEDQETAVYLAKNINTGQYYIGATSELRKRIASHINTLIANNHNGKGTDLFQKAYNWDQDFQFTAMAVNNRSEAFSIEKRLIIESRGDPLCLNMKDAVPPPKITDKVRDKLSKATKKRWEDPAYREKMAAASKERWEDPVYQNAMSDVTKKRWEDPAYREKMAAASKERWEDPEYRSIMETYVRGSFHREHMSRIHSGKIESEETRLKKSLSKKGIPQSPELIEKRAAALRGRIKTREEIEACKLGLQKKLSQMSSIEKDDRLRILAENSKKGADTVKRPVIFNGVHYESVSALHRAIGGSSATLYKILKTQGYEVNK